MNKTITNEMTHSIEELRELDKKHYLHPSSSIKQHQEEGPAVIFTEGSGIYLKDIHGNTVIDGLSCLWNVHIGHGRQELGQVALEQMSKLAYSSSFTTFSHEPAIRLTAKLAEKAPGNLNTVFLTSGGSESNDTAFKLVRHYWMLKGKPEKKKIVSRKRSYHGVAMGATSATGLEAFRKFTPSTAPDFYHIDNYSVEAFKEFIESEGADTIAAYISEPIQGTGGVIFPPENYFIEIKALCEQHDILFIADEVITGFGRTGTYFAVEQFGITPDLLCFAKGVTSGYMPLGGVIISETIYNDLIELSEGTFFHGYTYSGHPTACVVALKNMEIIEREQLVENAKAMGEELYKGFRELQQKHSNIGEVRTFGLLGAIELVEDQETNKRFSEPIAPKLVADLQQRGLICRGITYEGADSLVFAPPLIITKEQISEIITVLDDAFTAFQ